MKILSLFLGSLVIILSAGAQSTNLQVVQDSVKVLNGALSINNPANRFYAGNKLAFKGTDSISLSTDGPMTLKGGLTYGDVNDSLVSWNPVDKNVRALDAGKYAPFLKGAYPSWATVRKHIIYLRDPIDTVMFGGNSDYAKFNFIGTTNFYDGASFGPAPAVPGSILSVNGYQSGPGNGLSVRSGNIYDASGALSDIWSFSYVNQNDTVNSSYVSIRAQARTSAYSYQGSNLMAGMEVLIENGATNGYTTYKNAEGYRAYFGSGEHANYRAVRGFHVLPYEGVRVTDYFAGLQIDSVQAPVTNLYGIMQKGNNMKNSFAGKLLIGNVPSGSLTTDSVLVYNKQDSIVKLVSLQALSATGGDMSVNHLKGNSTAPAIAANAGAGTSPTISVTGTDLSFRVTLTAGTSPSTGADLFTVTFNTPYTTTPRMAITSMNDSPDVSLYGTSTTTAAKVSTKTGAGLVAGQLYVWDVTITQ